MANTYNAETKKFTKECIVEAFLQLLVEKEYEKITISEIARKAGVSRNAIYRNFESKEMILKNHINAIVSDFIQTIKDSKFETYDEYISVLVESLCENERLVKIIIDAGLTEYILESFVQFKGYAGTDSIVRTYYESFRIGGFFSLYITWLNRGCKEPTSELTEIVKAVINADNILPVL